MESLISVEEMIEDCSVVLERVLGTLADEALPIDVLGFLHKVVEDRQAVGSVGIGVADHLPLPSGVMITLRHRLFRCLFLRILRLCEHFRTAGAHIEIEVGFESPVLRVHFSSQGMAFPEAVAAMLRTPLSLHGSACLQSAFFFHIFVIGLLLRELCGSLVVSDCPATGGDTVVLVLSSPSALLYQSL